MRRLLCILQIASRFFGDIAVEEESFVLFLPLTVFMRLDHHDRSNMRLGGKVCSMRSPTNQSTASRDRPRAFAETSNFP